MDLGAIIDYAASFGVGRDDPGVRRLVGARERGLQEARSSTARVDLVQLFAASGTKNGADIRLAVDAVEDLVRPPRHHARGARRRRLRLRAARPALQAAGPVRRRHRRRRVDQQCAGRRVRRVHRLRGAARRDARRRRRQSPRRRPAAKKAAAKKSTAKKATAEAGEPPASPRAVEQAEATDLLVRAVRVGLQKSDDEWVLQPAA